MPKGEMILDGRRVQKRPDGRWVDMGPAKTFAREGGHGAGPKVDAQISTPQGLAKPPPLARYRIYYRQDQLPCEPMPSYPMKQPYEEIQASMWGAGPGFLIFETPHGRVGIRTDKVEEIRPIHPPVQEEKQSVVEAAKPPEAQKP